MANRSKTWLDALTDGQLFRDWFSLIAHFFLGMAYFGFLMAGYATAIGLSFVLIGIPLLLFMLATTRVLAAIDRRLIGAILDEDTPDVADDVDTTGANLGERIGLYLGSGTTWRSLFYLLLKFPLGMVAFTAAMFLLPLLALEVLILGPLTIDMRLASVRLQHTIAVGLHRGSGLLLPAAKRKRARDVSRLETRDADEPVYFLDDEGEIVLRKRNR
jgi:hypothetical protein